MEMGEFAAKMMEEEFTPELIEEMRSKKGLKLRVENHCFNDNEEATRGAIRRFADGIGDPNPLWRDEEFGPKGSGRAKHLFYWKKAKNMAFFLVLNICFWGRKWRFKSFM
jgi:hypothetical protein